MQSNTNTGPSQKYLETLLLYYEEEIEGEAYFYGVAERLSDPGQKEKMQLLAQIENYAAAAVAPLLAKHGLTPRSSESLQQSGQRQALAANGSWDGLMAEMRRTFPGYVDDFKRLEALAPQEDLGPLIVLSAHEIAAVAFLEAEAEGVADSAAPLRHYLKTGTA